MIALEKKYFGLPTASSDGTARLWNTRTGALKREYQARSFLSKRDMLMSIRTSAFKLIDTVFSFSVVIALRAYNF
jgi:hypothetical protein